jgi:hypothetical protein
VSVTRREDAGGVADGGIRGGGVRHGVGDADGERAVSDTTQPGGGSGVMADNGRVWGVAEDRASGLETGGRTTRASVCQSRLGKDAPPS